MGGVRRRSSSAAAATSCCSLIAAGVQQHAVDQQWGATGSGGRIASRSVVVGTRYKPTTRACRAQHVPTGTTTPLQEQVASSSLYRYQAPHGQTDTKAISSLHKPRPTPHPQGKPSSIDTLLPLCNLHAP